MSVYVTQENPRVNIVPALRFGELKALASPHDQAFINPKWRWVFQLLIIQKNILFLEA